MAPRGDPVTWAQLPVLIGVFAVGMAAIMAGFTWLHSDLSAQNATLSQISHHVEDVRVDMSRELGSVQGQIIATNGKLDTLNGKLDTLISVMQKK